MANWNVRKPPSDGYERISSNASRSDVDAQLDVLVMVYLSGNDGIDGADLRRLLPQHNPRNMRDKLWDFCAWEIAIEDEMEFGMIRYRLNAEFPQCEALTALLDAVMEMCPNYQRAYALWEDLWPERRATRERNRYARPKRR
jgi:hypothetical protein